jgi:hypothetical protein
MDRTEKEVRKTLDKRLKYAKTPEDVIEIGVEIDDFIEEGYSIKDYIHKYNLFVQKFYSGK